MKLLVYSPVSEKDLQASLGLPEYSYRFVEQRFAPILGDVGEVLTIVDPDVDVPSAVAAAHAAGEDCVLLSFAPPNRSPVGLGCPTITVFAWEFDSIPDEQWPSGRNEDWTDVLSRQGQAITLSTHSRDVVLAAMGPDFPVTAIPAPIYDRFCVETDRDLGPRLEPRTLDFAGVHIDSREFIVSERGLSPTSSLDRFSREPWSGAPMRLEFTDKDEARGRLVGFYPAEPWGTWSQLQEPWVLLPSSVAGPVRVTLYAAAFGPNVGRQLTISIGDCARELVLGGVFGLHVVDFDVPSPDNVVRFAGLRMAQVPDAADVRSMGVGLCWMSIEETPQEPPPARAASRPRRLMRRVARKLDPVRRRRAVPPAPSQPPSPSQPAAPELTPEGQAHPLVLDGVVYTSIFNPNDGRKNWIDMMTAFCWAFRDVEDATLVLKMTHHSLASYFGTLQFLLYRVGPVKCRILTLQGYLTDEELRELAQLTTYYVNASEAEGLCMPLMEFMSAGVPAIAPAHTAMRDYVTPASAFEVRTSQAPAVWPHDPRKLWRAHKRRVHWDSLVAAYERSYRVAKESPATYREMSAAATERMAEFSSDKQVVGELTRVVEESLQRESGLVVAPGDVVT